MFQRRLTTLVSLIVLVGIMFGLGACATSSSEGSDRRAESTPTPIPTSVVPTNPTYQVQRGTVIRELQFTGRVAPVQEEELFFKTGGYVDAVYVRRNDQVEAGDLLAELEVTDLKNQITQSEAELQAVQLDYDRRITEATNNVRGAELRVAKLQASGNDSQILSARINLERAQERLANAQDEYNKSLDRHWERPEVREAYADAVREAQWNLDMAQAQYNDALNARARIAYDIELAQMDLDLAQLRLAEIQTGVDVTRTVLSLNRLRDQLNDARIVAPFDGVILQNNVMEGRQVQGYSAVMTLADPTELEISADLQSSEMSELSEGAEVVAEFVNRPGEEFTGVIRRLPYPYSGGGLGEAVDDDDSSVRITLDNADQTEYAYDLGDRLRMTVELERAEDALWLSPQAVRTFEGRSFVVLQEGGAQIRRDVRLGIRAEDRVEIVEGLEEGQTVVAP